MIARIEWMLADHLFGPSSNLNIFHAIFMKYFYSGNKGIVILRLGKTWIYEESPLNIVSELVLSFNTIVP